MTDLMTPRGHLANLIAQSRSRDNVSAGGVCPLTKTTIQLLPVRYGLVEHLTPPSDIPMPHTLQSKAMGIRLLRNGYLYVIDNTTGYLHEYFVEQGSLSKLLWQGTEVASDVREHAIEGGSTLTLARRSTVYVAYSEIQWTAYKCSQVIRHATEREHFMQRVDLTATSSEHTGQHLLTEKQATDWLAEVAENRCETGGRGPVDQAPGKTLPDGASTEENTAYIWEHTPLFRHTWIEELTSQVDGAHQRDFLFLVVRDDIGIMRDLAAAQLKVADWIGQWSDDDALQRQYLTGAYIQSLYDVSQKRLSELATDDPRYAALIKDTTESERETLLNYLRIKRDYHGPGVYGDESHWRELAQTNPFAKASMELRDALGDPRWQRHREAIVELNFQTYEALHGAEPGERGIDDLVNRHAMQAFVLKQQTLLQHWQGQLKRIRADRLKMIVEGHFHRAAWYYDFQQNEQIRHRLETELECVAAICDDREAMVQLEAYLEKNPLVQVPGLDTLGSADQLDLKKKLADLGNFSIKLTDAPGAVAELDALANQFNSLMRQRLPNYQRLTGEFQGLSSLLGGAYDPARQMRTAHRLDIMQQDFQRGANINPNEFIRNIGSAARLRLLSAYATSGLTLRAATPIEIQNFTNDRSTALNMRHELKELYKQRRHDLIWERDVKGLSNQIVALKARMAPVEDRLSQALTPGGKGPSQFGLVLGSMDAELSEEMQRTVRDYRSSGTFKGPVASVLKSKGDQIAVVLFYLHAMKFVSVIGDIAERDRRGLRELAQFSEALVFVLSAGFAATQGLAVSILQYHIGQMESSAGKLSSMARLGQWSAIAGLGAFAFGFAAATIDFGKHARQWGIALSQGDGKKLAATSLQMSGDAILMGTNGWGFKHTYSITTEILRLPRELRALAWAEKSPRLINVAVRANVIGVIGMALQLVGEGLYNYFNLDGMKKWMHHSAWGHDDVKQGLEDDWSDLAAVVQQPLCQLIRNGKGTELRLTFPGVRTAELDRREVSIEVYQRQPSEQPYKRVGRAVYVPPYWEERSEYVANRLTVLSQGNEGLVLRLPILSLELSDSFGLAWAVSYKVEDHRPLRHRTIFHVLDIHRSTVYGVRIEQQGTFNYKPHKELPARLRPIEPWFLKQDELKYLDAE
ncbi:hypothetical protein QN400_10240 [Pseudomonas sp. RTC3]|uniref:toxin VasX n=1 Tax=Pseudomonas sp. 5C2 TaxID=3048588 RepID=UPI002AB4CBF0|nr:toxin VasX [Pseudomonas sp. 5C2]MDY7566403.1 hypothetical protein [Pseudomonas sp. 5C2]MEB0062407.1 hypothetical protein [Pseudomonas sp. RTC3]MEB0240178.1 hypothetical protein [Pseudomonas sp. 5C2]